MEVFNVMLMGSKVTPKADGVMMRSDSGATLAVILTGEDLIPTIPLRAVGLMVIDPNDILVQNT